MKMEDLTTHELLAVALRTKSDDVMVKELVSKYGSARTLYLTPVEELTSIKGVGVRKAQALKAILELGLRLAAPAAENLTSISSPSDAYEYLKARMRLLDREHFVILALNIKNRVLRVETVSVGSVNSSIVHPREVFVNAIRLGAASLILCHNHPSGDPTPSAEDINVTRRLVDAGEIVGIQVLDHIVIGNTFLSMKEMGLM